ncbi:caspase family protein [Myxococcota bacterium]|nr:caspase family protein [Myxococcota bacterium]
MSFFSLLLAGTVAVGAPPPLETLYHPGEPFQKTALSHDGRWLVTDTTAGAIVYDTSGRVVRKFTLEGSATYGVAFHPTRAELYVIRNGLVRLDVATGQVLASVPSARGAMRLGFDRAGQVLVLVDHNGNVQFADATTLAPIPTPAALDQPFHTAIGERLFLARDAYQIPRVVGPGPVRLCAGWDDGKRRADYVSADLAVAVTWDDAAAALVSIDCATGKPIATIGPTKRRAFKLNLSTFALSLDGSTAFVGASFVDLRTGVVLGSLEDPALSSTLVTFSADGRSLLSLHQSSTWDGSPNYDLFVRRWPLDTLRPTWTRAAGRTWPSTFLAVPGAPRFVVAGTLPVARSPEGHLEVADGGLSPQRIIDAETGETIGTLKPGITAISERFGAVVTGNKLYGIATTNLATKKTSGGKPVFRGASTLLDGLAVSADGKTAVMAVFLSEGPAFVVFRDGRVVRTIPTLRGSDAMSWSLALDPSASTFLAADGGSGLRRISIDGASIIDVKGSDGTFTGGYRGQLAFSADGARYAAASATNGVHVYDAATNRELSVLRGHAGWVTSIAFHPTADLVATASLDGSIKLWRPATGELLVTLVSPTPHDFAVLAPDGDYMGSRGSLSRLQLARGLDVFPFESFELLRHRPDHVAARVGFATPATIEVLRRAVERRARLAGFELAALEALPELPTVRLTSAPPRVTTTRSVTLGITAEDPRTELDRLEIYVNGVPLGSSAGLSLRSAKARRHEGIAVVTLSEGVNHVDVSVVNVKGVESLRERRTVVYAGPTAPKTLHVIAVGVSDYADDGYDLDYAAKDAQDVARTLERTLAGRGLYDAVSVHVLTDARATRDAIVASKKALEGAKVDDLVVTFIAGHGLLDDALDYYFAPTDADFAAPAARGVPYAAIEGLLDGIAPRRKLLLMDTCFSGELDRPEALALAKQGKARVQVTSNKTRGIRRNTTPVDTLALVQELFSDVRRGTGAQVISSAGGAELALESDQWSNGVFTYALLEALAAGKADTNTDTRVFVRELHDYVVARVLALTGGQQRPTSRRENLTLDFPLR